MTTLSGRVSVRGASKPATTATVELLNPSGDIIDQVRVDDQGAFTYHLVPGHWSLNAWDAGGHRGRAEVTLREGEDKVVDLHLEETEGDG